MARHSIAMQRNALVARLLVALGVLQAVVVNAQLSISAGSTPESVIGLSSLGLSSPSSDQAAASVGLSAAAASSASALSTLASLSLPSSLSAASSESISSGSSAFSESPASVSALPPVSAESPTSSTQDQLPSMQSLSTAAHDLSVERKHKGDGRNSDKAIEKSIKEMLAPDPKDVQMAQFMDAAAENPDLLHQGARPNGVGSGLGVAQYNRNWIKKVDVRRHAANAKDVDKAALKRAEKMDTKFAAEELQKLGQKDKLAVREIELAKLRTAQDNDEFMAVMKKKIAAVAKQNAESAKKSEAAEKKRNAEADAKQKKALLKINTQFNKTMDTYNKERTKIEKMIEQRDKAAEEQAEKELKEQKFKTADEEQKRMRKEQDAKDRKIKEEKAKEEQDKTAAKNEHNAKLVAEAKEKDQATERKALLKKEEEKVKANAEELEKTRRKTEEGQKQTTADEGTAKVKAAQERQEKTIQQMSAQHDENKQKTKVATAEGEEKKKAREKAERNKKEADTKAAQREADNKYEQRNKQEVSQKVAAEAAAKRAEEQRRKNAHGTYCSNSCYDHATGFAHSWNSWRTCNDGYLITGFIRGHGVEISAISHWRCCKPCREDGKTVLPVEGCTDANWWGSFDRAGWSWCPDNYYIKGFYKSSCNWIYCIESARCCRIGGSSGRFGNTCGAENSWWGCLDGPNRCNLPNNKFMTGLYRNWCHALFCIEAPMACAFHAY